MEESCVSIGKEKLMCCCRKPEATIPKEGTPAMTPAGAPSVAEAVQPAIEDPYASSSCGCNAVVKAA